ncbi:TonB family protein [Dasania sp. GY-MA-18]|uniref:TonB family protein n=1 Tax=Dasania phycosphaerae TaxID=2950436 RepID=A0A9J6RGX3_9GAMM|nr:MULTISPECIES: TonB family protein [Dasania]MCR8921166.1 TonB family protein [Dasania sp. GY-MA-18]MCZ0863594.1 TonB family protein [Dasania phycosphaerae]MCZ0867322.1 TonB family protein [Dasania phycosphaerae]
MNKISSLILVFLTLIFTANSHAQDSAFDELTMNGLASFQKLRKEYYIGALYLERNSQNPEEIIAMPGNKRMDIRVVDDTWSPRRFAKEWTGSILLNNEPSSLEKLTTQIQSFTQIPSNDLVTGDRLTIDMAEGRHTTIYLNNHRVFRTINNDFFYALLNTWIGSKPPSTEFRQNILKLPRDEDGVALLTRYENLSYSDKRKRQIIGWSKSAQSTATAGSSAAFAPPGINGSVGAVTANVSPEQDKAKKAAAAKKAAEEKAAAEALAKAKAAKEAAEAKAAAAAAALAKAQAEQARQEAMNKYQSAMYQVISKNVRYPKRSQQRGERGRAVVVVELDREGKILNLTLKEPTQFARLNNAAEKAFKVSEPFPPIPTELSGNSFEFVFPINF